MQPARNWKTARAAGRAGASWWATGGYPPEATALPPAVAYPTPASVG